MTDLMIIDLKELMNRMYVAGFSASGEGYNGEYPFDECERTIRRETYETFEEAYAEIMGSVEVESRNENP